jgi:hypothetical protein
VNGGEGLGSPDDAPVRRILARERDMRRMKKKREGKKIDD